MRKCPVTGTSIHIAWLKEKELLRPLPTLLPEPFDLIKHAEVHKDCTIRFEGRTYSVPYRFAGQRVEVRGCSGTIQIVDPSTGQTVKQYPRNTEQLLLIDQACYEPSGDDHEHDQWLPRPLPLGRMARHIEQLANQGTATRSIDFYASIAAAKATESHH